MTTASVLNELPKSYQPAKAEAPVRAQWLGSDTFHGGPGDPESAYCILIPPPNVTAALHLGHAFNNTLQDVLTRFHRMRGRNTLWMPGTDHAGIATQTVVEKRLQQKGQTRSDFTREAFVEQVRAWKDEYERTITEQLQEMGCSCDWPRQRFTMDPMCAAAVREAFFRMFADGLIYRGLRLVNWDPITLTALADDEVENKDVAGNMWYLQYPLADGGEPGHVTVATTRPETMLGDTAVAINPNDPRAAALRGRHVKLPIVDRVIPIIEDPYVVLPKDLGGDPADPKAEFATGFLKVTPAHDPNDWEIGLRHDLEAINIMAPDASISDRHGWDDVSDEARSLVGRSREDARKAVVDWFRKNGLLESVRDYAHTVGHSYRSHVPIEPYLSHQWFVRVTDDRMAGEALRALDGEQSEGSPPPRRDGPATRQGDGDLRFFPARYARSYQSWHENLRDWCISRQIWWGHRIPVWSASVPAAEWPEDGTHPLHDKWSAAAGDDVAVSITRGPEQVDVHVCLRTDDAARIAEVEADGFARDEDVLDTWFSSGLWPMSTMGWPDPSAYPETEGLLDTFNPSSVLCTGRDIITLWVSRMVMFNRYFRDGRVPFRHVYINPMIQDGHGQRMSKSLGNGVDPRDMIHSHGADALRYVLCQIATSTQDVRLPVDVICPNEKCGHSFHPNEITSPAGYRVAAPELSCPKCDAKMVSGYGVASGKAAVTDEAPLARNGSSKFDEGRNFANKVWNASRFALANLERDEETERRRDEVGNEGPRLVDRWIVSRLHQTLHVVEDAIAEYQFNVYADAMYDFVWGDFCDWYLEAVKPTVRSSPAQQQVLRTVLNATLRLLHPICPFVTETLWPHVQATGPAGLEGVTLPDADLLAAAAWPDIACRIHDQAALDTFERIKGLVVAIRTLRGSHGVPPRKKIRLAAPPEVLDLVGRAEQVVTALAGLEAIEPSPAERPAGAIPLAFEGRELLLLGVADAVDLEAERNRLEKLIEAKRKAISGFQGKLGNEKYVNNAPAAVVEETRTRLAEAEADLAAAEKALESLGGS